MLWIHESWSKGGVWDWEILKKEYSPKTQKILSVFLAEKSFMILMCLQVFIAAINIFDPHFLMSGVLLLCVGFTAMRWRGTFNGGSDYMTTLILLSVFVSGFFPDKSLGQLACFAYIGIQTVLSYFLSGLVKLKEKSWRKGKALKELLLYSNYIVDEKTKEVAKKPFMVLMASVIILIFECTFPLALTDHRLCMIYLSIGFLFHLENFFVLGLNRFVFAWLAAYPAINYLVRM